MRFVRFETPDIGPYYLIRADLVEAVRPEDPEVIEQRGRPVSYVHTVGSVGGWRVYGTPDEVIARLSSED